MTSKRIHTAPHLEKIEGTRVQEHKRQERSDPASRSNGRDHLQGMDQSRGVMSIDCTGEGFFLIRDDLFPRPLRENVLSSRIMPEDDCRLTLLVSYRAYCQCITVDGDPWIMHSISMLSSHYLDIPQLYTVVSMVDEVHHRAKCQWHRYNGEQHSPCSCANELFTLRISGNMI